MGRWLAFAAASLPALWLSWPYLRDPRAHGFYRFFAFEAVLGRVALNSPSWFLRPAAPRQIISWLLLSAVSRRSPGSPPRSLAAHRRGRSHSTRHR